MPEDLLVRRVRDTIRRHRMLAAGDTVVAAVSGGPDSTALLHVLADLRAELGLTVCAAHFNHGLRPDAADDAEFVGEMSRSLGLSYHEGGGDARSYAEQRNLSIEDAARRLRYEFLFGVARGVSARVVATGHTLDDQAETVLMRVLRGSGLRGLAGIPPVRTEGDVRLIRPLLDVSRGEIEAYLTRWRLVWREDSTNLDPAILRNRIRMVLLPMIEGYNPEARRTLARLAGLMRDEAEAIDALVAPLIDGVLTGGSGGVQIAREPFLQLPVAVQRRAILEAVRRVRGNADSVAFVHLSRARRLVAEGRAGAVAEFPDGIRVTVLPNVAEVAAARTGVAPVPEYRLDIPGRVVAPEFGVYLAASAVDAGSPEAEQPKRPGIEDIMVDQARVGGWLTLRGPRPGDRFAPRGMGGRMKKLSDYLTDAKVPRHRRRFVPVLAAAGGEILWIVGMRAAEHARLRGKTHAVRVVAHKLRA